MSWGQVALSKYLHSFRGCIPITPGVLTRYLPVLVLVYIPVYLVSLTPEPDTAGAEFSVLDVGQLCQWDSDSSWHSWDLTPEQLAPPAEPLNTESHVGSFTEFNENNNYFKDVVLKKSRISEVSSCLCNIVAGPRLTAAHSAGPGVRYLSCVTDLPRVHTRSSSTPSSGLGLQWLSDQCPRSGVLSVLWSVVCVLMWDDGDLTPVESSVTISVSWPQIIVNQRTSAAYHWHIVRDNSSSIDDSSVMIRCS